jgi:Flp pilus assembly protein TadD
VVPWGGSGACFNRALVGKGKGTKRDRGESLERRLSKLQRRLDKGPETVDLHVEMANALHELADVRYMEEGLDAATSNRIRIELWTRSAVHLSRACGLAPDESGYHRALAWDLHNLALHDMQLTETLHAARLAPDDPDVLLDLAHALDHAGRHRAALKALRRALALCSSSRRKRTVRYEIAKQLFRTGRAEEALAELRALVAETKPSKRMDPLIQLAQALEREGRLAEALAAFEEAAAFPDADGLVTEEIAGLLVELGRPDEAAARLASASEADPADDFIRLALAEALIAAGRPDDALAQYAAAAANDPDWGDTQTAWGKALLRAGRTEEALVPLRRAVEINPDYPEPRQDLADALAAAGRTAEARSERLQAAELAGDPAGE